MSVCLCVTDSCFSKCGPGVKDWLERFGKKGLDDWGLVFSDH